jgi:hypothetical protein
LPLNHAPRPNRKASARAITVPVSHIAFKDSADIDRVTYKIEQWAIGVCAFVVLIGTIAAVIINHIYRNTKRRWQIH